MKKVTIVGLLLLTLTAGICYAWSTTCYQGNCNYDGWCGPVRYSSNDAKCDIISHNNYYGHNSWTWVRWWNSY